MARRDALAGQVFAQVVAPADHADIEQLLPRASRNWRGLVPEVIRFQHQEQWFSSRSMEESRAGMG